MNRLTPRYLECQFEERSEPVSVEAGILLVGGGVGMVGDVLVCLVGGGMEGIWVPGIECFECHM